MSKILSIKNLQVRYGDLVGVSRVSIDVVQGSIVAILGSNGSGKTTTLNAIAGLVKPTQGEVQWRGESITGVQAYSVVRRGIALSPEGWHLFTQQSVEKNLLLGATSQTDTKKIAHLIERVYTYFPRLKERRLQRSGTLSGGERQMLAVGRALMSDPKLLMLDEPSLGLAPAIVESMYETLAVLHKEGLTLLIAEQSVQLALEFAQYAYVLQTGVTVLEGNAKDLISDPQVRKIYLGLTT